jgi:hypothetical protein
MQRIAVPISLPYYALGLGNFCYYLMPKKRKVITFYCLETTVQRVTEFQDFGSFDFARNFLTCLDAFSVCMDTGAIYRYSALLM